MSMRANQLQTSRRQRGAIAVTAAILVTVAIIVLGALDVGNLYFQRRDLQRIADMAALAAAQSVDPVDIKCAGANQAAQNNANQNDSYPVGTSAPVVGTDQIVTSCGRWDPPTGSNVAYQAAAVGLTQFNAARVTINRQVNYSFIGLFSGAGRGSSTVSASSTARATAIDSFSVSATIASVNPVWLNAILTPLLGTSINLQVGDYQAIANANIRLIDIATAVGAGTVTGLTTTSIGTSSLLGKLVNLDLSTLQAGQNNNPGYVAQLQAGLAALNKIQIAKISNTTINLANQTNALLQVGLGNPDSAADATVNLLDLLTTTAQIANAGKAVSLSATLPLGANTATNVQLQILSPPSLAIGEAGQSNGVWRTQASSAQIGLFLNVQTPPLDVSIPGLPALLSAQLSGLNLPLYLVVGGPATAWLAATKCGPTVDTSSITIGAKPGIARLCVSAPPGGTLNLSNSGSCPAATGTLQIVNLNVILAGLTVLSLPVTANVGNPVLQVAGGESYSAPYGSNAGSTPPQFCADTANYSSSSPTCSNGWSRNPNWTTYSNQLGSQLAMALANLNLQSLNIALTLPLIGTINVPVPVSTLSSLLSSLLGPVLTSLDVLIVPLLNLLGVQVGQANVHQISLTCNAAQLVGQ
ncbi:hypothetical protein KEC55_07575 [Burkholderia cepacia]|uniref:pilus assembly protein TadG-related protein n=1 Tax=Burkholderia cepacia TaxID=292 RepID=UPI00249E8686|nr:pilus assembly protein TadG-related protein [Burkholderia cepacia]WGY69821.1 hypothetical protein KEC55_07575 [Burkholderia cepacia]